MSTSQPRVLLIEPNPDLDDLERTILDNAGYRVEASPPTTEPVSYAERTAPDLIVLGIRPHQDQDWQILDRLQANPRTRTIPVVVISTSERAAGAAKAAPAAQETVVAPYDIVTVEDAVARALKRPPAAGLPVTAQPVPTVVAFAADALSRNARRIVLQAIRQLQQVEPYQSRFRELTPGLVDDLAVMFGAIVEGFRRNLPPEEVFATSEIRQAIEMHVRLRESQGIGLAAAIREDHAIQVEIDRFIVSLIGPAGFTARDALEMGQRLRPYTDELVRIIATEFRAGERGHA